MDKEIMEKNKYAEIIRDMIKHENEVRNQRTNWFLVIQGFLIAGICELTCETNENIALIIFIIVVGIVTSISFLHAAWRSTLAVTYALSCWKEFLGNDSEDNYPPVSLITKEILKAGNFKLRCWKKRVYDRMYDGKKPCEKCVDSLRNRADWLLPYKFLPPIFLVGWLIYGIYLLLVNLT